MKLIQDIWSSFRRMPLWVQIWVALILVPINMLSLAFLYAPNGLWVAILAIGGMTPNLFFMIKERGFSSIMAVPHIFIWTPLVILVACMLYKGGLPAGYTKYLWALLVINVISLAFDFPDSLKWLKGKRDIA